MTTPVIPVYSLSIREPIKVIGDVLASEMGLIASGPDCQIMITNERFVLPVNNQLYIALSYIGPGRIISNGNFGTANGPNPTDGMTENQQMTMFFMIQIDLLSYNPEARMRFPEVAMALGSMYAQGAMGFNNLQIARQPSGFMDNSMLEETKRLFRYTTTIGVTALLTKSKAAAYYNGFPFQFSDENYTSPILIPEDTTHVQ